MVVAGFAITFGPVDVFSDAAGLHEYELAPPAARATLCPLQMVSPGDMDITGEGFTVRINCAVDEQPFEFPVTV